LTGLTGTVWPHVVGPTNTPIAALAERRRVRVHDPDDGIGWDIVEATASVHAYGFLKTSLDLGQDAFLPASNYFLPPLTCTGSYTPVVSATPGLP
jgi:hypothetical protein